MRALLAALLLVLASFPAQATNVLNGNDNNNTLTCPNGDNCEVYGRFGNDTIRGPTTSHWLRADTGGGADITTGSPVADRVDCFGGDSNERFSGGGGGDTFICAWGGQFRGQSGTDLVRIDFTLLKNAQDLFAADCARTVRWDDATSSERFYISNITSTDFGTRATISRSCSYFGTSKAGRCLTVRSGGKTYTVLCAPGLSDSQLKAMAVRQ